jgi:DNA-directed RNA polymerase subunit E'/Rpb7
MQKQRIQKRKDRDDRKDEKIYDPYIASILSMKIHLPITEVGGNIKQNLERMIVSKSEGKCIVEGFVRPDSVHILTYSAGKIYSGLVEFQTTFECMICHPVEGTLVRCKTNTITKAGIHAEVIDRQGNIPITIFIARDHHLNHDKFEKVVENAQLLVNVIGIRYELNDVNICAIGKLVDIEEK